MTVGVADRLLLMRQDLQLKGIVDDANVWYWDNAAEVWVETYLDSVSVLVMDQEPGAEQLRLRPMSLEAAQQVVGRLLDVRSSRPASWRLMQTLQHASLAVWRAGASTLSLPRGGGRTVRRTSMSASCTNRGRANGAKRLSCSDGKVPTDSATVLLPRAALQAGSTVGNAQSSPTASSEPPSLLPPASTSTKLLCC